MSRQGGCSIFTWLTHRRSHPRVGTSERRNGAGWCRLHGWRHLYLAIDLTTMTTLMIISSIVVNMTEYRLFVRIPSLSLPTTQCQVVICAFLARVRCDLVHSPGSHQEIHVSIMRAKIVRHVRRAVLGRPAARRNQPFGTINTCTWCVRKSLICNFWAPGSAVDAGTIGYMR